MTRVIRALELFLLTLFTAGLLLIGVFATWTEAAPYWFGGPVIWLSAAGCLITLLVPVGGSVSRACVASLAVFAAYILIRAGMSDVPYIARTDLIFCLTAFVAYVLVATCFTSPRSRYVILIALFLLIAGNTGMGFYQQFADSSANPLSFKGYNRSAADAVFGGFYPNSNHLAGYMELTGFIALALACFGRVHSFVRLLCGLVFIMAGTSVVMSTSRAGWMAMMAGVVMLGVVSAVLFSIKKRGRAGGRAIGIVVASLVLVCGMGILGWQVLEKKFGQGNVLVNLNGRDWMWTRAMETWQLNPVFGMGARAYEYYERRFRSLSSPWVHWNVDVEVDAVFAHNDWLQLLADFGLVGLVLAVVLLLLHIGRGVGWIFGEVANRRAGESSGLFSDYRGAVLLGTVCGLGAFAIHCVADFQMHTGANSLVAAILLGMLANPGKGPGPATAPASQLPRILLGVPAAALSVWALLMFLPWAKGDWRFQRGQQMFSRAEAISQTEKPSNSLQHYFSAFAALQEARELDPKNHNAYFLEGLSHMRCAELLPAMKKAFWESALDRFRRGHTVYPQYAYLAMFAGETCDFLGRYADAEPWHKKALEWGSGNRQVNYIYADHLMLQRKWQQALDFYTPTLHKSMMGSWQRAEIQSKMDLCRKHLAKLRAAEDAKLKAEGQAPPVPEAPVPAPTPEAPAPEVPAAPAPPVR